MLHPPTALTSVSKRPLPSSPPPRGCSRTNRLEAEGAFTPPIEGEQKRQELHERGAVCELPRDDGVLAARNVTVKRRSDHSRSGDTSRVGDPDDEEGSDVSQGKTIEKALGAG